MISSIGITFFEGILPLCVTYHSGSYHQGTIQSLKLIRTTAELSAMDTNLKAPVGWSTEHWLSVAQLLLAAIMTFSLVQTSKVLNYNRIQIEMSKLPQLKLVKVNTDEASVILENTGPCLISDVQIVAKVAAKLNQKDGSLVDYGIYSSTNPETLATRMQPRASVEMANARFFYDETPAEELDTYRAHSILVEYKRDADGKIFYQAFHGAFQSYQRQGDPKDVISFLPIGLVQGQQWQKTTDSHQKIATARNAINHVFMNVIGISLNHP